MRFAHNQYYVSGRIALQIGFITYKYTLILHKYTIKSSNENYSDPRKTGGFFVLFANFGKKLLIFTTRTIA